MKSIKKRLIEKENTFWVIDRVVENWKGGGDGGVTDIYFLLLVILFTILFVVAVAVHCKCYWFNDILIGIFFGFKNNFNFIQLESELLLSFFFSIHLFDFLYFIFSFFPLLFFFFGLFFVFFIGLWWCNSRANQWKCVYFMKL